MKTICIQIGNTDDKLTQLEWSRFCTKMISILYSFCGEVHFSGMSNGAAAWQNACFVVSLADENIADVKARVSAAGRGYLQDSIAWLEGETEFI